MWGDVFGYPKGWNFFIAKDFGHFNVWYETSWVFGILEVVPFQVTPKMLDDFWTACETSANDVSQFRGELHFFGETGGQCHVFAGSVFLGEASFPFLNFILVILMLLRMSFRHFFEYFRPSIGGPNEVKSRHFQFVKFFSKSISIGINTIVDINCFGPYREKEKMINQTRVDQPRIS